MEAVWEFIKGVGAVVGLVTGGFVLWERLIREKPQAFLVSVPLIPGSVNMAAKLRIINRSVRPILISWKSGVNGSGFRIAKGDSTRAIVAAQLPGDRCQAVAGNETIDLVLLEPSRLADLDGDSIIETEVFWQFAQPQIWKWPRRLPVKITKADYLRLLEKKSGDGDD
jgi:hypothetical protein